jgi:hypothetical protein
MGEIPIVSKGWLGPAAREANLALLSFRSRHNHEWPQDLVLVTFGNALKNGKIMGRL